MARKVIKKLCLLGDGAVGKTSLIRRYVFDTFTEDYKPTIGTKIVKKPVFLEDKDIEMVFMIWDIMGQKSYHEIPQQYYQGVEGVILVADITRRETLANTAYWLKAPFKDAGRLPAILVINKADLQSGETLQLGEVEEFASSLEVPHYYVSAKTGEKVEAVFSQMANALAEKM